MKNRIILRINDEVTVKAEDAVLAGGHFEKEGIMFCLKDMQCKT